MEMKYYFLVFFGLLAALEAKKLVMPPSYPYLMKMELIFKDENISNFIAESFFATKDNNLNEMRNCNISLYDVLSAIPFKDQTPESLISALEELNVTLPDDEITRFVQGLNYTELTKMGFSTRGAYKNLVKTYFQNSTEILLACLNILDIAADFTTTYAFGTDENLFLTLQKGNFSVYNLREIAAIINAPVNIKTFFKTIGVKHYDSPYVISLVNTNLTRVLDDGGLERKNFEKFLNSFGLTVSSYKDIKSFKTFYKSCTDAVGLGVAISANEVITNDYLAIQKLRILDEYTSLRVRSVESSSDVKHIVSADKIRSNNDDFITIQIDEGLQNYINRTKNYEGILLKNCTYVTVGKHSVIGQNATVRMIQAKLTIVKQINTLFTKGSPLVCDGILYGLAASNDTGSIGFSMVGDYANVEKIDSTAIAELYAFFMDNIVHLFNEVN